MFLIAALVIVSSLLILKISWRAPTIVSERRTMEVRFENDIFENLIREFNKTLRISFRDPLNMTTNMHDFGNFTRHKMAEHSMDLSIFFVGSTANKTTSVLNVSVVNLYGSSVDVNLTLNNTQSDATSDLADYARWDTNFTITPGSGYILTVTYNQTSENVTIKTKANKDVYVGFFDIRLESSDATHKNKYQKTFNLKK